MDTVAIFLLVFLLSPQNALTPCLSSQDARTKINLIIAIPDRAIRDVWIVVGLVLIVILKLMSWIAIAIGLVRPAVETEPPTAEANDQVAAALLFDTQSTPLAEFCVFA